MSVVVVVCCQVEVTCDGPTLHPTEREVSVYDIKTSTVSQARSECGCCATEKKNGTIYTEYVAISLSHVAGYVLTMEMKLKHVII